MTTTKNLRLTFLDTNNKSVNLIIADAKDDLDAAMVGDAMKKIASAGVFVKNGAHLYHEPKSASYIERTVTDVYTNSEVTESKQG